MPEPSSLSLAVGDRVVYPNQGVCRVSGVESKEVAGQKLTFVTMKREEDGAVVMVPQAKVQTIGLRKIASKEDVHKIFAWLSSDSDKTDLDWKQRARANLDRMSQGGIRGLAEVVKGLQVLSELRPLPTKERELYDNARHLLVTEISASLGMTECDAEDAVDVALFPPGKERPKRTAAEFKVAGSEGAADEEGLEAGEDLLSLGGDLELPPDEAPAEEEEPEEAAEGEEEAEEKPAKVAKAKLSDTETTATASAPVVEALKRGRGRPPKAKAAPTEAPAEPKKRGRPPKPKVEAAPAAPKKRGRPPKAAAPAAKPPKPGKKK